MPRHTSAEQFYERVRARHGNSVILGEYTKAKDRISARCARCNHEWQPVAQTLYVNGCQKCHRARPVWNKGNATNYRFQLWNKYGDRVRLRGTYSGAMLPATHYCRVHKSTFSTRPQSLLRSETWECCPRQSLVQRGLKRRLSEDEVRRRIEERHGSAVKMVSPYVGTLTHHQFRCDEGHEWQATPDAVMRVSGCPTCNCGHSYSQAALRWIETWEQETGRTIQHAENGGEKTIQTANRRYRVDGYDPATGDVYEFHGDAFHGNPAVHKASSHPNHYQPDLTARQLHRATKEKERALQQTGHRVIVIWESDWNSGSRASYILEPASEFAEAA